MLLARCPAAAGAPAACAHRTTLSALTHTTRVSPGSRSSRHGSPVDALSCSLQQRSAHRRLLPVAAAAAGGGGGGASGGSAGGGGGAGGSSGSSGGDPHPLRVWTWAYAALLAAGGAFAFAKAGSTKSLTSAGGAALILALSGRSMVGAAARGSIAVCLALSLLLSILMANRYQRSRKLMPAGLTAGVSLGMCAAYVGALIG